MFFESPLRWAEVFTDDLRCKGNQKRFTQNYKNRKFGISFSSRKIPINDQWCSNNGLHSIIYGPISLWQGKRANLKTKVPRKKRHQIFRRRNISCPMIHTHTCLRGQEIIVFQKISSALFSCYPCFEIRPFALLPTNILYLPPSVFLS